MGLGTALSAIGQAGRRGGDCDNGRGGVVVRLEGTGKRPALPSLGGSRRGAGNGRGGVAVVILWDRTVRADFMLVVRGLELL